MSNQSPVPPLLSMRGINKSFGAVHVLHDVDFDIYRGQVTALVGDNGAGKSTLVKCLAGIYGIDAGQVSFDGRPVTIHSPREASSLGIEVVYQDLALCDNLDIVENMFLGRERTNRLGLDDVRMEILARETLDSLHVRTESEFRVSPARFSISVSSSVSPDRTSRPRNMLCTTSRLSHSARSW